MVAQGFEGQAKEFEAVYSFRGLDSEMAATLPLLPDETVITQGAVGRSAGPLVQRPVFLRLTTHRFAIIDHFAFRADRVTAIPPSALTTVDLIHRVFGFRRVAAVSLVWQRAGGGSRTVALLPRVLRLPVTPSLPDSADELVDRILTWRNRLLSDGA